MVDVPFTEFAFAATGTSTLRTMPDRLAEVKNVKDFGATGNGSTDDRAAIQAAVDWTTGADRGVIYFPLGTYKVGSPGISFDFAGDISIVFRGEGTGSRVIGVTGGGTYYVFDRSLGTPVNYDTKIIFERMNISHANGGCIRVGSSVGTVVRSCNLAASLASISTEDAVGVSSRQLLVSAVLFTGSGTQTANSFGVLGGGGGVIEGCDAHGVTTGYRLYGSGWQLNGGRTERCDTAVQTGVDSAGNDVGCEGFSLMAHTFEGCYTAFDTLGFTDGFSIFDVTHVGHEAGNSGVSGTQGGQYGYRFRADKVRAGLIISCNPSGWHDVASIMVEDQTNRAFLTFMGCAPTQAGGAGVAINDGTKAHNAYYLNNNFAGPIWTYATLPSGANVFEGEEYDISDATVSTFGAAVSVGGGSTRVRVRRNASGWTVCGV